MVFACFATWINFPLYELFYELFIDLPPQPFLPQDFCLNGDDDGIKSSIDKVMDYVFCLSSPQRKYRLYIQFAADPAYPIFVFLNINVPKNTGVHAKLFQLFYRIFKRFFICTTRSLSLNNWHSDCL